MCALLYRLNRPRERTVSLPQHIPPYPFRKGARVPKLNCVLLRHEERGKQQANRSVKDPSAPFHARVWAKMKQIWLAMYHLMCEEECRKRYHFNSMRKNNILRARKYLNDVLLDQLPVLAAVQRQAGSGFPAA